MKTLNYSRTRAVSLSCTYVIAPVAVDHEEQERTGIKKKLFLEVFENSRGFVNATCKKVDIARATYYNWLATDPDFKAEVDEVRNAKPEILLDMLYNEAFGGNTDLGKFLIKHIHPDFRRKPAEKKEVSVHMYHHPDKKPEAFVPPAFEDIMDNPGLEYWWITANGSPEEKADLKEKMKEYPEDYEFLNYMQ